jgi:hypothetical protein
MHFKLSRALGVTVPVLLGSALVAGAAALPASAQTYQDTSLSGTAVTDSTFGGSGLGAASDSDSGVIKLSGSGVSWVLHGTPPSGVSLSGGTISYSGSAVTGTSDIVADASDSAGNAQALIIPVALGSDSIQVSGDVTKVSLSSLADTNSSGTVKFSADSSLSSDTITIAETNLPAGLTSGNPLTYSGGTAAPGTYSDITATASDSDGAMLNGTFSLTVTANTVNNTGTEGNEVNKYGNGFDAYKQHAYAGAIIAGWPATQNDPATHFIMNTGSHAGAYQFEYAPNGTADGLCISDPGGGWSTDPLRDGLVLANCNTGPWQQFIPQSNGTLQNVATGLYVNPDGTGGQLRGGSGAVSWGGSSYTWTDYSNMPS